MPKAIEWSVGRNGLNLSIDDVITVQYLLNCVPQSRGGPSTELRMDGIVTPETIAAIVRFQRVALTLVDGCVEPTGATLVRLQQLGDEVPRPRACQLRAR